MVLAITFNLLKHNYLCAHLIMTASKHTDRWHSPVPGLLLCPFIHFFIKGMCTRHDAQANET